MSSRRHARARRVAVALAAAAASFAWAQDADQIMREADRRQRVTTETYAGELEVTEPGGKVFRKSWTLWRAGHGGDSRILVRFQAPPEVDGVGLLILARRDAPDQQWMYTPAIRRDRRIAPQDRSSRFLGTDFSFEDMEQRDVEDYEYRMLGSEPVAGASCWKIRARPRRADQSQYRWSDVWIRKDNYVTVRIEMYVEEALRKVLELSELTEIEGVWSARLLRMQDLKRGGSTTLRKSGIRYNGAIDDDFFSLRTLRAP